MSVQDEEMEVLQKITIHFSYPVTFPDDIPEIEVFVNEKLNEKLTQLAISTAKENTGARMIYVISTLNDMQESLPLEDDAEITQEKPIPIIKTEKKFEPLDIYHYIDQYSKIASLENYVIHSDEYQWTTQNFDSILENRIMAAISTNSSSTSTFIFGGILDGKWNKSVVIVNKDLTPTVLSYIKSDQGGAHACPRVLHSMTSCVRYGCESLVISGGLDRHLSVLNDIWILNDVEGSPWWWVIKNKALPYRYGHTSLVTKTTLWMFGGKDEYHQYCNTMIEIDLVLYQSEPIFHKVSIPVRMGHVMAPAPKDSFLISGGVGEEGVLNDIWLYHHRTGRLEKVNILGPSPQFCFSSGVMQSNDSKMAIIGGYDGSKWNNNLYVLDLMASNWKIHFTETIHDPGVAWACYMRNEMDYARLGGITSSDFTDNFLKKIPKIGLVDYRKEKTHNLLKYNPNSSFVFLDRNSLVQKLSDDFDRFFKIQKEETSDIAFLFKNNGDEKNAIFAHQFVVKSLDKIDKQIKNGSKFVTVFMDQFKSDYDSFYTLLHFLYTGIIEPDKNFEKRAMKLYLCGLEFNCRPMIDFLTANVTFRTVIEYSLSVSLMKMTNELLIPKPVSELEKSSLKGDLINIVTKESFEPDASQFYIQCHKSLLMLRSDYFKMVFESNFSESTASVIEIEELTTNGLITIVRYLYSGSVPAISPQVCVELYLVIHKFQVEELKPYLRTVIREHLDPHLAIQILEIADSIDDGYMINFCRHFIAKNLDELNDSEDYQSLNSTHRCEIEKISRVKK